jgi:hypothetical protein
VLLDEEDQETRERKPQQFVRQPGEPVAHLVLVRRPHPRRPLSARPAESLRDQVRSSRSEGVVTGWTVDRFYSLSTRVHLVTFEERRHPF